MVRGRCAAVRKGAQQTCAAAYHMRLYETFRRAVGVRPSFSDKAFRIASVSAVSRMRRGRYFFLVFALGVWLVYGGGGCVIGLTCSAARIETALVN